MTNKPHPPLCPGRKKGYFYHSKRLCYRDHIGILLDVENQDDREFICRDQACAWLDRAKKRRLKSKVARASSRLRCCPISATNAKKKNRQCSHREKGVQGRWSYLDGREKGAR